MVSGVVSSFVSLPFDNAKTKLQKMKPDAEGKFPYKNIFDAMMKTVNREGFSHLWVGYLTFYIRIAPHIAITLLTQDFLTEKMKEWRKGQAH